MIIRDIFVIYYCVYVHSIYCLKIRVVRICFTVLYKCFVLCVFSDDSAKGTRNYSIILCSDNILDSFKTVRVQTKTPQYFCVKKEKKSLFGIPTAKLLYSIIQYRGHTIQYRTRRSFTVAAAHTFCTVKMARQTSSGR